MVEPLIYIVSFVIILALFYFVKNFTVVPNNEVHVITGRIDRIFDGKGQYILVPLLQTRKVLHSSVQYLSFNSRHNSMLNYDGILRENQF
ncbi:MAG: hypothetical protein IH840_11575 [Candidatus Heimdallarchaeota archaeon]|nr:hypothetical protein [Candidatus Heimdallarchaeota archaeon]